MIIGAFFPGVEPGKFWVKRAASASDRIPESALYPKNDMIEKICQEIGQELITTIASSTFGEFLKLWTEFEQKILMDARNYKREVHNIREALLILMQFKEDKYGILKEFDYLRMFRNKLVHNPTGISNQDLHKNIKILMELKSEY